MERKSLVRCPVPSKYFKSYNLIRVLALRNRSCAAFWVKRQCYSMNKPWFTPAVQQSSLRPIMNLSEPTWSLAKRGSKKLAFPWLTITELQTGGFTKDQPHSIRPYEWKNHETVLRSSQKATEGSVYRFRIFEISATLSNMQANLCIFCVLSTSSPFCCTSSANFSACYFYGGLREDRRSQLHAR